MNIKHFFDPDTSSFTYVVWDEQTRDAVVIDPVLNFDPINLSFSEESINEVISFIKEHDLTVRHALETHIHADHVTGASRLRDRLGVTLVVGSKVPFIRKTFQKLLALQDRPEKQDIFDVYLDDNEVLTSGSLSIRAIHTPGHTPACTSYQIEDAVFVGDSIFMPDFGTGRCDFPEGSADILFHSITRKLYALPDETRVFVGHDYQPGGRELSNQTTIGTCKKENIHLSADTSKEDFLEYRTNRDKTLKLPRLLFQSVQLNIYGGELPEADSNGLSMLRIPVLKA